MESANRNDYGLLAVRILFYFAVAVVLIWFFTDYYATSDPALIPLLDKIQLKSLLETAIYFVLFLIIFLPQFIRLMRAKQNIDESCESGLLYQRLLAKIGKIYSGHTTVNTSINSILDNIGTDLDLDRAYLYRYNQNSRAFNITHQFNAGETTPLSKIQSVESFEYPIFTKWVTENIPVYIIDVRSISDQNTRTLFLNRNAYSVIVIPLTPKPDQHYLLCLESHRLRKWSKTDISDIYAICLFISGVLERNTDQQHISQLDELKMRFIEVVSNQLKGPLQAMRQNVENLVGLKLGNLNDIQQKVLTLIYQTNVTITQKISNMIMMLDYETGHVEINRTDIDLLDLVNKQYADLVQICLLKDQKPLLQRPTAGSIKAFVDKDKISFAIKSLMENASFYSHKYGEIIVKVEATPKDVIFSVQDQGIGIPVADQNNIFVPFYRALNAREMRTDSPGISLFMTKKIIESHGGKIGFTTRENEGSYFWFTLPRE